jgi:hypothetical protein
MLLEDIYGIAVMWVDVCVTFPGTDRGIGRDHNFQDSIQPPLCHVWSSPTERSRSQSGWLPVQGRSFLA